MAEPAEYGDGDQRMDLDKWGGQGISLATDENHVRCQAYRNAFYSCAAKTHIDLQDEKCQSYWLDARECFFGRRMVEKLKVFEQRLLLFPCPPNKLGIRTTYRLISSTSKGTILLKLFYLLHQVIY